MFYNEGNGVVDVQSHEDAVARCNAIRKKQGKPPLSNKLPGGAEPPPMPVRRKPPPVYLHPRASKPTAPPPRLTGIPEDPNGPFPEFPAEKPVKPPRRPGRD